MKETLTVGQIINTHGLKGELKVYPLTDDVRRFRKLKSVLIDDSEKEINWCKLQNDRIILKLEGVDSIESAMAYKNKYISIKREDAVELPEGRFFVADIIGCSVVDTDDNDLGTVFDVIFTKNNDVYWVKGKKELMVPVLENIVLDIDIVKRRILIKPVGDWLDED